MPNPNARLSLHYAAAVLAVAVTTAIRFALDPFLGDHNPFLFYYAAIAFSARYGGLGPSLLALALSGVSVDYFFLAPRASLGIASVSDRISFAVFLAIGLAFDLLAGSLRKALSRAESSGREARRALKAERAQRVRLRTTLESIADAVITADPNGRVTGLNPAAERLTGWAADDAAGCRIGKVFRTVDEATRKTDEMPVAEVLEGGAVVRSGDHTILVSRDGRLQPVEHSTAPIRDEGGKIGGMVLIFRDVTERCQAERAVRESEEQYRALFSQSAAGIAETDLDGRFLRANDRYCEIVGHDRSELIGARFQEITHPDDRPGNQVLFDGLKGGGPGYVIEKRYVRKGHSTAWARVSVSPIRDDSGRLVRATSVIEDVTERKRLEGEVQSRVRDLAEVDRRKDEFLAMLAHELRNPLAPLASALELMRCQADGADFECERSMAERQVRHLARLIDDLMDVSRINKGKVVLRKEAVDLGALAGRVAEAARPLLAERRHELTVTLPDSPIRLEADPTRLEQVLTNLLNNASKYTDPGGHIRLIVEREGAEAVVRVGDTGVGIETVMLGEVFGLFVQVERRLDRSHGGLGIGLSLVKSLVEMHGGSVEAQSEGPGRGSEFVVRLPALDGLPCGRESGPWDPRPRPAQATGRRILVVDDNVDAADSLSRLLSRLWKHEVKVAYDGPRAIEVARSFRPDAVLLDIGLPGMDGCEVARRLRELPEFAEALLVAVTGWGQERDRLQARASGFDHHLVKPVDPERLKAILEAGDAAETTRRGLATVESGQ